ncbi:MAG: hypothetical protein ACT4OZ_16240 [Gemmatimonadota bacterium]
MESAGPGTAAAPRRQLTPRFRLLVSLLVVAGGLASFPPLVVHGPELGRVAIEHGLSYQLIAPFGRTLDEMSLLTDHQHRWLLISWFVASLVIVILMAIRRRPGMWRRGTFVLSRYAAVLFGTVLVYAIGALVPRPMAALSVDAGDVVVVDFHSHTLHSHDGRWNWTFEDNRRWHTAAGFHAAYVTDHSTFAGWSEAAAKGELARRRNESGGGTSWDAASGSMATLLPGVELVVPRAHVNLIGVRVRHSSWLPRRGGDLDTIGFASELPAVEERPLALLTLPFDLSRDQRAGVVPDMIELTDASPRGLGFSRRHRELLIALADSLDVPLVAGSNNHGWGSTAAAWTLLRVPGWRALDPWALDHNVRSALRDHHGRVSVVERTTLGWGSEPGMESALVLPLLGVQIVRAMAPMERLSTILWIWLPWLLFSRTGVRSTIATIFARWISDSREKSR